jgi:hypothetical protein
MIMNVKMHLLKTAINTAVRSVKPLIPKSKPEHIPTKVFASAMDDMLKIAEYIHATNMSPDKNFINLVETLKSTMIYLAENDNHYRSLLHAFLLIMHRAVNRNIKDLLTDKESILLEKPEKIDIII